jgi:hypothetical protein
VLAYNALTGGQIKRFDTRTTGVRRLLEALSRLPPPLTPTQGVETVTTTESNGAGETVTTTENNGAGETVTTTESNGAGETTVKVKRGPNRLHSDSDVIKVLAEKNPQRPGSKSHSMHDKYRDGMTVKEALDAGITMSHIVYGNRKGHIRVNPTELLSPAG